MYRYYRELVKHPDFEHVAATRNNIGVAALAGVCFIIGGIASIVNGGVKEGMMALFAGAVCIYLVVRR